MKAWVLKTKKGKYLDYFGDCPCQLNEATLWSSKKDCENTFHECYGLEKEDMIPVEVEIHEV